MIIIDQKKKKLAKFNDVKPVLVAKGVRETLLQKYVLSIISFFLKKHLQFSKKAFILLV